MLYNNPLILDIPYTFLLERLSDPPDDALKSMLSITLILFVYLYPVVRGLILHWYISIFASFVAKDNRNVLVRHGIHPPAKFRTMPTLYDIIFTTAVEYREYYFSWDMDGILFVI